MSDSLDLEVQVAGPGELDAFVALLEGAGGWLWRRGIRQWEPGSHHAQLPRLTRDLERGCVHLARIEGKLAAGVILDWERGPLWQDRPGDAGYVYKLAVARALAGRGVGLALLRHCESHTAQSGRQFVRLDCWSGNDRLRAYYADNGYVDCGEAEEHGARVARFEKRVLAKSHALESRGHRA